MISLDGAFGRYRITALAGKTVQVMLDVTGKLCLVVSHAVGKNANPGSHVPQRKLAAYKGFISI
jgi:hypothetical protein